VALRGTCTAHWNFSATACPAPTTDINGIVDILDQCLEATGCRPDRANTCADQRNLHNADGSASPDTGSAQPDAGKRRKRPAKRRRSLLAAMVESAPPARALKPSAPGT
jgi:hypothetical protein